MRRFFLWYWLLTRRLFRRGAFWALLLCVPLLAGALAAVAKQESSIVRAAIYVAPPDGPARRSADRLLHADSLVRCTEYGSEAEAIAAVRADKADAAWIFLETFDDELERFVGRRGTKGAVRVVEREDNVFLRLAREQLAAAVYPEASYALFRSYLIERLDVDADAPDALFKGYYSTVVEDAPIIVFSTLDGAEAPRTSYLVAPVRGLLALLLVLTGIGSAMGYTEDARREVFLRLRAPLRRLLPLLVHLTALVPMALAALLALRVSGLLGAWPRELGLMGLYCAALAAGSELLRKLCRRAAVLGALIPALTALLLALCPIFFDVRLPEPFRRLLVPYDYLNALRSAGSVWWLAGCALVFAALGAALPEPAAQGN